MLRSQGHIIPQLLAHPHGSLKGWHWWEREDHMVCHHEFSDYHLSAMGLLSSRVGKAGRAISVIKSVLSAAPENLVAGC